MRRIRVIPILLLHNRGLVKSVRFRNYKYVGDPINAVRIFNEKEVDEICILDITATRQRRGPDQEHISEIVSEAFMPLSYGGGVTSIEEVERLFFNGVEKVVLNHGAVHNQGLIGQIADRYGRQSVTASIDHKAGWLGGSTAYSLNGEEKVGIDPVTLARRFADAGAGEILLNSIDRDGTYAGFDLRTVEKVARAVRLPVVACGGAGSVEDLRRAIDAGASAVAAGSLFVFQRPHNAVLISYPPREVLEKELIGK
ncbi:MAG: AglZ/HisF2 family acetamidino modification protein [Fimbriimonadaceae bacterium]|nr:AglZ/HisF2 family acetamidino modification protein [Fimbriimonadaceae bacterium]